MAGLPREYKKFETLLKAAIDILKTIKGADGISVNLKRDGNNLLAEYSNGRKEDLGSIVGEDGTSPEVDYGSLKQWIREEIAGIKLPKVPTSEELIKKLPNATDVANLVLDYLSDNKDILPKGADGVSPAAAEIASYLIENDLLPRGPVGPSPKIDDIAKETVGYIVGRDLLPEAPTVEEILRKVKVPSLEDVMSEIVMPDTSAIADLVLSKVKMPADGKDHPLSETMTVVGSKVDVRDKSSVEGLSIPLPEGLTVLRLWAKGTAADANKGYYSCEKVIVVKCIGSTCNILEKKDIYNPVVGNGDYRVEVKTQGSELKIFVTGTVDTETTWAINCQVIS